MNRRLSEIEVGKTVLVKHFEKDDIFLKLMEMGCVPGETIIIEQVAPLGDPISILVAGYHLSFKINEGRKDLGGRSGLEGDHLNCSNENRPVLRFFQPGPRGPSYYSKPRIK
jgi:ferrous iron transport protein A